MKLLTPSAALRARLSLRPRAVVLLDLRGTLTAGELLDQVQLHRRSRRTADRPGLGALPANASLRQVLVTALAGNGMLELRSSGSTGSPRTERRGPLSVAQLATLADLGRRIGMRRGQRIACAAPGVHGHGLLVSLGSLALGATLVDLSHLPAPQRVTLLHRSAPDLLTGVPVHLVDLLTADRALDRGQALHIPRVVSGSDQLSPGLRADLARHFRARVHDVYGTTETGSLTVDGTPLRGVRLREVDGLLHARTPFTAGQELVTDRGEITADGVVRVLGRADGTLSSGGMVHDPASVLRLLRSQRGVLEARLRVVPDDRFGVRTVAEVRLLGAAAGTAPGTEELRALVRDQLGAASVPREMLLSTEGPCIPDPRSPECGQPGPSSTDPSSTDLSSPGR
ncbi:AMP-binding protein [Brachybacterium paraconglomeratum]|uniref:AMP-binding protein n=1 Tax=Brachybacterium paraconglomeratum TaxID=173362 RepID=UPI0031F191E3